jgi:class 3 adenylate cyclase/tetratricopeptide (TPR) repeat protein
VNASPGPALPSGVVTFLLTDIEGSTALWDHQPAAMAAALERHDALVGEVVAAHDGTVLKAKGEGDATLSVFRRASDAVAAAVELQRAIAQEAWPSDAPINVRMGVHTGEAHEREGDYFGPTVNRAARIRALATGGEILVSQATAEVVHDRMPDAATLGELGMHRLTGVTRPEQVFAVRVRGLGDAGAEVHDGQAQAIPLPAALAGGGVFVGRQPELGTLAAAWAQAQRGERGMVLVAGEPGIGKTSLVGESARAAHQGGAVVLFGHCDEEALVPFQPFVEALAHWVTSTPVAEVRAALGPQAADLALLVPEARHRLPGLADASPTGSETERYRVFEAVPTLLHAIASRAPVLLVIDDLHWADRPTLQLLVHTIRRTAGARVLVLATYRDTEIFRTHPLAETLVDLRRADVAERVALRGLSRDDVGQLVSLGREPGPDEVALADALWRDTEGSPLFLRETLRHLEEVGAVAQDERGAWLPRRRIDALGIPEGVKEVIGRRLTRLSEEANDTLRTAAVIGRQFDPALVGDVSGTDVDRVLDTLDEAITAGVVSEVPGRHDRFEFTHALVRDALYDELSISRRVRMHQRIGDAIERLHAADLDPHLGELAYHFSQAAVAGVADKAIDYARRAGDRAMAGVAYEEAVRLFDIALDTAEDAGAPDSEKSELLLRKGQAQWRINDFRTGKATLERAADLARRTGDAERLGRAALLYAGAAVRWVWLQPGVVDEQVVALLEEALAALDDTDSPLRARLLAWLGVELHFQPGASARCDALSREGVAMARRTGDRATLAFALCARNLAVMSLAFAEERLAAAEEAVVLAEELGDKTLAAFAHGYRFMALLDLDRVADAKEALAMTDAIGEEIRDPLLGQQNIFGRAGWARLEGDFEEAERLHRQAFMFGQEVGDATAAIAYFAPMLELRRMQGRLHEVAPAFEGAGAVFPILEELTTALLAWIHGEARTPDAARYFQDIRPDMPMPLMGEGAMWSMLARVFFHYGDAEQAAWIYERALPHAAKNATVGANMCSGTVSHTVALMAATLGRREEAVGWFEDALRRYETNGWSPLWAEATGQLAIVLAETDPGRAEELAEDALAEAKRMGMARVAQDAEDLLARLRGEPEVPRPHTRVTRRDRLRGKITTQGRRVVERFVHGASDDDLVRRFGSPLAQRAIFGGMARSFQPAMAFGFEGAFSFELRIPLDDGAVVSSEWWTIEVRGRKASARRGRDPSPVVAIRVDLPDFIRMSAGEPPLDALVEGRLKFEGDPFALLRISAMFGAVEPFELLDEDPASP